MGASDELAGGDWLPRGGVWVWVSHVPKTAAPVCPSCGREIHLRSDGSVWKHLSSGRRCPGSGRLPVGDYERGARAVS
jgi:ribosomal protein L37AE/L43A